MESKTRNQPWIHNSQLNINEEDLHKNSKETQNQQANKQLLNSHNKSSSDLSNINNTARDFTKISLLNQENLIYNSKVYQDYIKSYHKFTSLYYPAYNHYRFEAQLIIYDTETKREKIQSIENIAWSKSMTQLPNGDLFCFCTERNHGAAITLLIDSDFNLHELPSRRHISCASAIYYNRSVYCFGGGDWTINTIFSNRFDLDANRWVSLSPLPKRVEHCTTVIFNGNILISNSEYSNIWLYSIDINAFSIIPYEFGKGRRVMVNVEDRLYLIESSYYWRIYESDVWDEFSWKFIENFGNACYLHGLAYSGIYNKEDKNIYILGLENWDSSDIERHYWKFNLNEKVSNEEKIMKEKINEEKIMKCRIF